MTTDPDPDDQFRDIARALVADAPAAPDWEALTAMPKQGSASRRWLAGAVAVTVLVGVGGIVATRDGEGPRRSGFSPASSHTQTTNSALGGVPTMVSPESTYTIVPGRLPCWHRHCTLRDIGDPRQLQRLARRRQPRVVSRRHRAHPSRRL